MSVISYTEFTYSLLKNIIDKNIYPILCLAPQSPLGLNFKISSITVDEEKIGYVYLSKDDTPLIIQPDIDFFDFFDLYKKNMNAPAFKACIALRVFEHIQARQFDWFLYQLYTLMIPGAYLHIVVPNMWKVAQALREVTQKWQETPGCDYFKFLRLNYELLSEGSHIYDRHALWTDEYSIKVLLEQEGLFQVTQIEEVRLDTNLVPNELFVVARRTSAAFKESTNEDSANKNREA